MTEGKCPSCGAPITFTAGDALVLVCPNCNTVVGRQGKALENRGKIATIVDTDTPLMLGADGRYENVGFTLVGHLQKDHGKGPWDEWYAEFQDGRTAWISESEGAFHVMFGAGAAMHRLSVLQPGMRVKVPVDEGGATEDFVVEEVGSARTVAAEGQLPPDLKPGGTTNYVDATGTEGRFCTLDFGAGTEDPEVFVGRQVPLESLGVPPNQLRPRVKKVGLLQARCTECNGPLELRAPDRTKRVGCPFCGALLDVSKGKLSFLEALGPPKVSPVIPLGRKGTLQRTEWICIGFLVRSCVVENLRYDWGEYLLYSAGRGFTWLMEANGHWTFLRPLPAGEVLCEPLTSATYKDKTYKAFQSVTATTDVVLGELYWEVEAGERARASEYIRPPHSLNEDRTENETTWTLGEYLEPHVIKDAFKLEAVPPRHGISSAQPNPAQQASANALKWSMVWIAALLVAFVAFQVVLPKAVVFEQTIAIAPGVRGGGPEAMYFSEPFEIPHTGNVAVEMQAPVANSWVGIQGDLVNEATQEVTSFYDDVSYYFGSDSDGSWTEGAPGATEYLSHVEQGRYVLRLTPSYDSRKAPSHYRVRLTAGVPRLLWPLLGLLVLLVMPVLTALRSASFESARWNESNLYGGDE